MAKLKIAKELFDILHPIGSVYLSSKATNPATLFGYGTWVQVKERYILAFDYSGRDAGNMSNNTSNGISSPSSATNTGSWSGTSGSWSGISGGTAITVKQMPSHRHPLSYGPTVNGTNPNWTFGLTQEACTSSCSGRGWSGNMGTHYEGGGEAHTHSIPSHTHSIPSHTHSIPSHTHEIPWVAFYCWYRTA